MTDRVAKTRRLFVYSFDGVVVAYALWAVIAAFVAAPEIGGPRAIMLLSGMAALIIPFPRILRAAFDGSGLPRHGLWMMSFATAVTVALAPASSWQFDSFWPWTVLTALWSWYAAIYLSWRKAVPTLPLMILWTGIVAYLAGGDWVSTLIMQAFWCASGLFGMYSNLWLWRVIKAAHEGQDIKARLAVAEERLRFARDLHDLLGHGLSVISLKSELSAKLAPKDATRAGAEMAEVRRLTRDALQEVGAAVQGYRHLDLDDELAAVGDVLRAAGIDCTVDSRPGDLSQEARGLFSWVVREGATNVLKHSTATRCAITVQRGVLTITNDGYGPASNDPGTGLKGLAERLESAGGTLRFSGEDGEFTLSATMPCGSRRSPGAPAGKSRPIIASSIDRVIRAATLDKARWVLVYTFDLVMLLGPPMVIPGLLAVMDERDSSMVFRTVVAIVATVAFSAVATRPFRAATRQRPRPFRWLAIAAALGLAATFLTDGLAGVIIGPMWLGLVVLQAHVRIVVALFAGWTAVLGAGIFGVGGEPFDPVFFIALLVVEAVLTAFWGGLSYFYLRLWQVLKEGHDGQLAKTRLAVADERLRFARDLHDLLGHSLSSIILKSELAIRVLDRDPAQAAATMTEVHRTARESLKEVRTAVRDYRRHGLDEELASVGAVMEAAGIQCRIDADAGGLTDEVRALLAAAVRDGVTGILKRGTAERCAITIRDGVLEIRSNDSGPPADTGLDELRERVSDAGGSLSTGIAESGEFLLRVIPGTRTAVPA